MEIAPDADPRRRLVALAADRGESLASLSALIGRNAAYLQQYVTRGSPRALAEADVRRLADYLGTSEHKLGGAAPAAGFAIPRLDIVASAGSGAFVDGEVTIGTDTIDPALARRLGLRSGLAGIVRVRGTSMEPGLVDGDTIVVDLASRIPDTRGGIYVIRAGDAVMVKRVAVGGAGLAVTSDNPDAAAVTGPVTVVGKVVWLMRAPR